jgi:hypothetical protein
MIVNLNANLKKLGLLVVGGVLALLALALFQLIVGYMGITHYFGSIAGIFAIIGLLFFRLFAPFVVGAFFGMTTVLGWHWLVALIITLPGIILIVPKLMLLVFAPLLLILNGGKPTQKPTAGKPIDDDIIEGPAVHVDDDKGGQ